MASKTKRPAPPPPPKNSSIPAKPPPPQRPSPQSSPSKPRPPPKVVNGAVQNQQLQTQKPVTDSHQLANSPVRSSTDMQSAQTYSARVPPQPTAPGRVQAQRAVSPPREPPQPPDSRLSSNRTSAGSVVHRQQPNATSRAMPPSQPSIPSHKPLSPASSSTGSIASQDQLMMKYKTVERNYEQLKNVARKGKSLCGGGACSLQVYVNKI